MTERVLHVMWSMNIGGAERALYQLVRAQRAAGLDAALLVAGPLGPYSEQLAADGIPVIALGQRRSLELRSAPRARRFFRGWDVVHFHVPEPLLMLAATSSGARRYFTHRAGRFEYPFARRMRYATVGVLLRKGFDAVAGNTKHAARVSESLFGLDTDEAEVVYNGIDWDLLRPERDAEEIRSELAAGTHAFVLGTTGNLRSWKRVDLVLRALAEAESNTMFVIVGDGPAKPALERLSEELQVADRVRFVGAQANVTNYLQILDGFVLASGPQESFGNSAVEAMGVGVPTIVMADGGGLVEHVSHQESGIVARDEADLARWIDRLATDSGLRARLGSSGRTAVRSKYTTDRMVEAHARLYARREGAR